MSSLSERIKALEEKVETMDMLIQSLHTELKKALEDIETLNEESDKEMIRQGLSDLWYTSTERVQSKADNPPLLLPY